MRILLIMLVAALGLPGLATAADKGGAPAATVADYMPAPAKTWTGPYLGVHLGAAAMDNTVSMAGLGSLDGIGGEGLAYGVMGGYDIQMGRIVLGLYGDYTRHDSDATLTISGVGSASVGPRDQWAIGGRAGLLLSESTLVYGLAGYTQVAYSDLTGPGFSIGMPTFSGWQAGGGVETRLPLDGWTLDARYVFSHLDGADVAGSGVIVQPDIHVARVGVNYKLGGF